MCASPSALSNPRALVAYRFTETSRHLISDRQNLARLRHSKIHAADCGDCETKEGMLDHIESDLEFAGRLTQEQRSKLLEIAQKCPVHRTLVSEIDIRSRVL